MITPAQYQHKLTELDLTPLSQPLSSKTQTGLQELQSQLQQLLQDVNRETHVIRSEYQPRVNAANRGGTSRVVTSGKQSSDSRRADEVARVETERDARIAPYLEVKSQIEDLLQKVEGAMTGAKGETTAG